MRREYHHPLYYPLGSKWNRNRQEKKEICISHLESKDNHSLTVLLRLITFPHIAGDTQTPGALVATAHSLLPALFLLCNKKISEAQFTAALMGL